MLAGVAAIGDQSGVNTRGSGCRISVGGVQGQFDSELSIGVNFSTLVAGATLAGEVSYRPNCNLQINSSDLSLTALPGALLGGFDYGAISPVYNSQNVGMQPGNEITGWGSAWA